MIEKTPHDTPASHGLHSAIPAGIDPARVAFRKSALLQCGAADRITLNGQVLAEQIALGAEREQVKRDALELARYARQQTIVEKRGGDLAAELARFEPLARNGEEAASGEGAASHPLTLEEAILLTPSSATR